MIPKILHRIWLGGPMPEAYRRFGEGWEELHPDWDIRLWGNDDFGWLENQDLFDNAEEFVPSDAVWQFRSDLARYEILRKYGGLYVDCDSEPLRNHNELMNAKMFVGWEVHGQFVANGIIGSVPEHPILNSMIDKCRQSSFANKGRPATWLTGPRAFSPLVIGAADVTIHPQSHFLPYLYDEIRGGRRPELQSYPNSFSVHHWNHKREQRGRPLVVKGNGKLSVSIMAHKKRELWVPTLQQDLPMAKVVWDQKNDRWETGSRSLLSYDPDAEWHMVVQDDSVLPQDFYAGVKKMLLHVETGHPVGLYYGRVRPRGHETAGLFQRAKSENAPFIVHNGPWWGVGIVIPTAHIRDIVAWGDQNKNIPNYDRRIARWYLKENIPCYYTNPSLIEHRTENNPSLVPGRTGQNRRAWNFVGPQSALDVDWSGPVVRSEI